ncbi:MAG: hypothetical protein V9G14_07935 [Cypionkella sp.]|nr:hypothetical protein [Cypionkella sp.]
MKITLALCLALCACTAFPKVEVAERANPVATQPPQLLPLDQLLAINAQTSGAETAGQTAAARAAALRARAAALRNR